MKPSERNTEGPPSFWGYEGVNLGGHHRSFCPQIPPVGRPLKVSQEKLRVSLPCLTEKRLPLLCPLIRLPAPEVNHIPQRPQRAVNSHGYPSTW